MAGLKDTKRRIVSVKNTQKITRAMKLVSAAKFARANQMAVRARPYGRSFEKVVAQVSLAVKTETALMKIRPEKKILVITLATDRGLCGGLNSNLLKKATAFIREKLHMGVSVELSLWGRRSYSLSRINKTVLKDKKESVLDKPTYSKARAFAKAFSDSFEGGEYDAVYFIYPKFTNAMTQTPEIELLLPVKPALLDKDEDASGSFIFEPEIHTLCESLARDLIAIKIYRYLLDGRASEHAARMTAMDNATNNASDVIKRLTLEYNRARQANITKELIEITSGAQALN